MEYRVGLALETLRVKRFKSFKTRKYEEKPMSVIKKIMGFVNRVPVVAAFGFITVFASTPTAAVEFDLRDTGNVSEIEAGVITRGGITATLTAIVGGNTGVLNQTTSGFGINATGTGDESSRLDGDEGAESVSITFDVNVLWTGLGLSLFSSGEGASISLPLALSTALADTSSASDVYTFASDNVVLAGEMVVVSWVSGNGFSFDSFDVELYERQSGSNGVPDGGVSAAMLAVGVGMVSIYRRRSRPDRA